MTTTRHRHHARNAAGMLLAAALGLTLAGCSGASNADPGSTLPTTPISTTMLRAQAIQSAKSNYRAWIAMQPAKRADLPQEKARKVATQSAIDDANADNKSLFTKGVTLSGTNRIISMKVTSYERHPDWTLVMRTCVGGTARFLKNGKDVTTDSDGKPLSKGTETRAGSIVTFRPGTDGDNWRVDTEKIMEKPC